jgi:DNA-binding beta-propeller fold protein YncE
MFALRRINTGEPLDDFFFDQSYRHMLGSSRDGKSARVVDVDTGKTIRTVNLPGLPHMGSGITFEHKGKRVMATPHLRDNRISVIDMESWKVIKTIETKGPGFFMRSHENSPFAWAGVFFGPNRDLVHIIDKRTLKIVRTLKPEPGKTAAHAEFDKTGEHVLLSIWEMDGAIIVYDAKTFKEVKRLKMSKPAGKYNVHNKITFSEGTSH